MEIRHILWQWGRFGGRLALRWAEGEEEFQRWPIELAILSGSAPEAHHLGELLTACLPRGWNRIKPPYPYRVEIRIGSSGCKDYHIRVLEDVKTLNAPIAVKLHISMRGALNQGVVAPIWAINAVLRSGYWPTGASLDEIRVVKPRWRPDEDFISPDEWDMEDEQSPIGLPLVDPDDQGYECKALMVV